MSSLTGLPDDVISRIYSYLPAVSDKQRLAAACQRLRQLLYTADAWRGSIELIWYSKSFCPQIGCCFVRYGQSKTEHLISGSHEELLALLAHSCCSKRLHLKIVLQNRGRREKSERKLRYHDWHNAIGLRSVLEILDTVNGLTIHVVPEDEENEDGSKAATLSTVLCMTRSLTRSTTHLIVCLSQHSSLGRLLDCALQQLDGVFATLTIENLLLAHHLHPENEVIPELPQVTELHLRSMFFDDGVYPIYGVLIRRLFDRFPGVKQLYIVNWGDGHYGWQSWQSYDEIMDLVAMRPDSVRELQTDDGRAIGTIEESEVFRLVDTLPRCHTLIAHCELPYDQPSKRLEALVIHFINARSAQTTNVKDWRLGSFVVMRRNEMNREMDELTEFCKNGGWRRQSEAETALSCGVYTHIVACSERKWTVLQPPAESDDTEHPPLPLLFANIESGTDATLSALLFDFTTIDHGLFYVAVFEKHNVRYHICFGEQDFWTVYSTDMDKNILTWIKKNYS